MELISRTFSTIKQQKIQFSVSWLITLLTLLILTSLSMLNLLLQRLDSADQIQLLTTEEVHQLQKYFFDQLVIVAICFFVLIVLFFGFRIYQQKKTASLKQLIDSISLEFFFELLIASVGLILFVILFEPMYTSILQFFYHQGLNQLTELPNFVLSNGTSGIAYSIRSPLSFDLSSTAWLNLFFVSLFKIVSSLFLCLCLLIFTFRLLYFRNK